jgi:hypothetical protein
MNNKLAKRIKQLAVEAGLEMCGCGCDMPTRQSAKFAELIVKECINEIHDADVGDLKGKGYYLDRVAEHIEKHFGV